MYLPERVNPFDIDTTPIKNTIILFLIHTNSLSNELASIDTDEYKLMTLSRFKEIKILLLPQADKNIQYSFNELNIISSEYCYNEQAFEIKISNSKSYHLMKKPSKNSFSWEKYLWKEILPGRKLFLADIIASEISHFLVVGQGLGSLLKDYPYIITAKHALELTRVLMTNLGLFYVNPYLPPISETDYYKYRDEKLFTSCKKISSIIDISRNIEGFFLISNG